MRISDWSSDVCSSDLVTPLAYRTGGPARYFEVEGLTARLGLITPLSNNFCEGCNRMRLTCEGKIFMCLGHEDHVDLKAAFRAGGAEAIDALLDKIGRAAGRERVCQYV